MSIVYVVLKNIPESLCLMVTTYEVSASLGVNSDAAEHG